MKLRTIFPSRVDNRAKTGAKRKGCVALILLCGTLASVASAQETAVRLKGSLSPVVARARQIGLLDKQQEIEFAITLPMRNRAELETFIKSLYTPGDPLYRRYLKTGEFAERFGPTQADYDAVVTLQ